MSVLVRIDIRCTYGPMVYIYYELWLYMKMQMSWINKIRFNEYVHFWDL